MPYEGEEPPFAERRGEPSEDVDALARAVIGAAIEVHRHFGPGLDEALYQNALAIEFEIRGIPFAREVIVQVSYKGRPIGTKRLDFVIGHRLILETKAIELLLPLHKAQVLTSLKITGHKLGLLINFNVEILKEGTKRIIRPGP